jgi:uncharacterized membrane protein
MTHSASRGFDRDRDPIEFGRIVNLSDGVFSVALTLLVISIVVAPGLQPGQLPGAILDLGPKFVVTAVSILVVGSAWLEHHHLFAAVQRADGGLIGRNLVHVGLVAFIPFPHQVLGSYPNEPSAYVLYAAVIAAVNAMELVLYLYARRNGLFRVPLPDPQLDDAPRRHLAVIGGFIASMPLAFVLVGLTPIIWAVLLPLERFLARRLKRRAQVDIEAPL